MADVDPRLDPAALIRDMGLRARAATQVLAGAATAQKADALRKAAQAIRDTAEAIAAANDTDMAAARSAGLAPAMLDRLMLDGRRVAAMADALETVAALPDPVGQMIDRTTRPNGLVLERVRVPIGVIAIVYESRPNVTADAGSLCLMAGNPAILRAGSEARHSARAIHDALVAGLIAAGLSEHAIQLVPTTDRAAVGALLAADGLVDLVIPRGGKGLVARVQAEARVPVLAHLDGLCHTYVDAAADPAMARAIVRDAKLRRTGICGATETLLMDRAFPNPSEVVRDLLDAGCEVRGDAGVGALDERVTQAREEDWDTEYLDAIVSAKFVEGVEGAIAHIGAHSSHHTDAIISADEAIARRFLAKVDSAIVLWNASTQFADGGEFGLGAEIGISTGRLHARGPVALEGLTTYKWVGTGTGQVRG